MTPLVIFGTIDESLTTSGFWDGNTTKIMSKIISYGLLLVVVLWLIASYLPESILIRPKASLEWIIPSTMQKNIFVVLMVFFVGIQVNLLIATSRLFKGHKDLDLPQTGHLEQARMEKFGLRRGPELFWTSVPVAMTFVVILLTFTIFS